MDALQKHWDSGRQGRRPCVHKMQTEHIPFLRPPSQGNNARLVSGERRGLEIERRRSTPVIVAAARMTEQLPERTFWLVNWPAGLSKNGCNLLRQTKLLVPVGKTSTEQENASGTKKETHPTAAPGLFRLARWTKLKAFVLLCTICLKNTASKNLRPDIRLTKNPQGFARDFSI